MALFVDFYLKAYCDVTHLNRSRKGSLCILNFVIVSVFLAFKKMVLNKKKCGQKKPTT